VTTINQECLHLRDDTNRQDLSLTFQFEDHGELRVALCNELPLGGIGDTDHAAVNNFVECLAEYLRLSDEWGVLDQVMAKSGFTLRAPVSDVSGRFVLMQPLPMGPFDRERIATA
jgi:hypothetical protein